MLTKLLRSNTSAILIDQAVVSAGNFLTALVLARLLLPAEYGLFSIFYLAIVAVNTCHSSLVVYPLTLRGANADPARMASLAYTAMLHTGVLGIPLAAVLGVIAAFFHRVELIPVLLAAMLLWQLQETCRRALLASQRAWATILPDAVCYLGQAAVLWLLPTRSLGTIFLVVAGTSGLAATWQAGHLRIAFHRSAPSRTDVREHGSYAWGLGRFILYGNVLNMLSLQIPGWTLALSSSVANVAGYQALLNLAGIANPLIFSINSLLIPAVARKATQGAAVARRTAARYGLLFGALLAPCVIALTIAPAFVIRTVYGPQTAYLPYAPLLRPFILGFAIQYVATVVGAYEGGMSRSKTYMHVQIMSAIALVLMGVPLIARYKVPGAIWAFLVVSVVRLIGSCILSWRNDLALARMIEPDQNEEQTEDLPSVVKIQICILTYQRPQLLRAALASVGNQTVLKNASVALSILVIDNDRHEGARDVVEAFRLEGVVPTQYCVNPPNGLSSGRNLALTLSKDADYLLFLDDDETASPHWVEGLLNIAHRYNADVVTGPVLPHHVDSPDWVMKGKFFDPRRSRTGLLLQHVATNNTLLRKNIVSDFRFDPAYDFSGGEDTDFFLRVGHASHRMIWCDEAFVSETVPPSRANLRWILRRAHSDAQRYTQAYLRLHGTTGAAFGRTCRALAGAGMGLLRLPAGIGGRHHAARGLVLIARASGTLNALMGRKRLFYGVPEPVKPTGKILTIAVVGQIPPPVNGQSIMIEEFLRGRYTGLELLHIPMRFSRSTSEIGNFGVHKVLHLLQTLFRILKVRFTSKATVLYYPPAGANTIPVLRDVFLLLLTRPFFRFTVFHFHAAGLTALLPRLPALLRPLFLRAYRRPDLAVFTTTATSQEALILHPRSVSIVPCGSPDHALDDDAGHVIKINGAPVLLFVGILCEGKGVMVLLQACRDLLRRGIRFRLQLVGAFASPQFEVTVRQFVEREAMGDNVELPGVLTGEAKKTAFRSASIFCFPSHYPAESFGVVLIEAMSYSLPIVATRWQGIPEVTGEDSKGTLLVATEDPVSLADNLATLLTSQSLRLSMGEHNRRRYEERFTLDKYRENLSRSLMSLQNGAQA